MIELEEVNDDEEYQEETNTKKISEVRIANDQLNSTKSFPPKPNRFLQLINSTKQGKNRFSPRDRRTHYNYRYTSVSGWNF